MVTKNSTTKYAQQLTIKNNQQGRIATQMQSVMMAHMLASWLPQTLQNLHCGGLWCSFGCLLSKKGPVMDKNCFSQGLHFKKINGQS